MHIVDFIEDTRGTPRAAGLAVVVVVFLLTAAAVAWEGRWAAAAVAGWGVVFAAAGMAAIVRRRFRISARAQSTPNLDREHTGAPAVVFGASLLAVGLLLLAGGLAAVAGSGDAALATVFGRPGPVVTAAGFWAAAVGLALATSRWRYVESSTVWWQRMPSLAAGALMTAVGVTLTVLGLQAVVSGSSWSQLLERVAALLARTLGG